jgi:hypothetical protein
MIVCDTAAAKSNAPDGLMIEFLQGPIVNGITDATPEFSWIVHSSRKNDRQSAYHIYDISDAVKPGENELVIKVTTVLYKYARTLNKKSCAGFWASRSREKSVSAGLIGPVKIR